MVGLKSPLSATYQTVIAATVTVFVKSKELPKQKKVTNCLVVSGEMCTFAADKRKKRVKMTSLNLINSLIIIRLRKAAGSDGVCV